MDPIFMNSENSKTYDFHILLLNLTNKINLKRSDKHVALSNLSIYYTWKNIKKLLKSNKFNISSPTWNNKFELPERLYFASDISDYFEYIIKKYEAVTDDPLIRIFVNKIENGITFKIKTRYYLELLMAELVKLLGSTKNKICKDKMLKCVSFRNY